MFVRPVRLAMFVRGDAARFVGYRQRSLLRVLVRKDPRNALPAPGQVLSEYEHRSHSSPHHYQAGCYPHLSKRPVVTSNKFSLLIIDQRKRDIERGTFSFNTLCPDITTVTQD